MLNTGWLCVSLLLVLPLSAPMAAMYKWVDEDGNVVYSDKPPLGGETVVIQKKSYGVSEEEAREQLESLSEKANALKQERDIKRDVAGQLAERDETIKKNCEVAHANLDLLTSQARVTLENEQGEDYFLSDADKESKTLDARANVDRYCNN